MEIASLKQRRCKDTSFAPFAFKLLAVRSTGRVHGMVFSSRGMKVLSLTLSSTLFLFLSDQPIYARAALFTQTDARPDAHASRTLVVSAMSSCSHVLTNVEETYVPTRRQPRYTHAYLEHRTSR